VSKSKLTAIEEKLRLTPDDPRLWLAKGLELTALNSHYEAVEAYSWGLYWDGNQAELLLARGRRYISLRRWPEALADLAAAARLEPEKFDNWYYQGVTLALLGDYQKAAAAFELCLPIARAGDESYLSPAAVWLWLLYTRLGRREEAAAAVAQVTPETKELTPAPSYKKIALLYKGAAAPDDFIDESQLTSDDPRALLYYITETYHLANYYYANGNVETSNELLRKLKLIDKHNYAFAYMLARQDMERRGL
jgi:tetratricopeptide (TPR) repeat protein